MEIFYSLIKEVYFLEIIFTSILTDIRSFINRQES